VGLGLLYLVTGSERDAGDILRRIRPGAVPHRAIVRYFDELLGCRLTPVSDAIRAEKLEKMRRELDLSGDALLEELPGAAGEA
jgi:hypothetical protein